MWSGATGGIIRSWEGDRSDGLFGHWIMLVPDVSGDGLADAIIAAPHAAVGGRMRGVVTAFSVKTGRELWRRGETEGENLGWDLALAGDQDGDGHADLFVGAPAGESGRVYLLSGKDGSVLRTYTPRAEGGSFGWYVARLDDLDGDGRPDLAVGAPFARNARGDEEGGAWYSRRPTARSCITGRTRIGAAGSAAWWRRSETSTATARARSRSPRRRRRMTRSLPGEVRVYAGGTGKELRHWSGSQAGEQFGRMVVGAGDLDGDGVEDVAIGAPWHRRDTADRVGRIELRSGRTGAVLADLLGDEADCWFGWHIRRAPDPGGRGRPALLISSLRHPVDGEVGVGVLDLYVLRRSSGAAAHGTMTRGTRRKDIR